VIEAALGAMQAAGELPAALDFSAITAEPPRDAAHGDIATNAAMVLAKAARKKPREIAEALLPRLKANADVVDGAVAGPGFINLKLSDSFWLERLRECLKEGVATAIRRWAPARRSTSSMSRPTRPGRCMSLTRAARWWAMRWPTCS
jgi:arginyl-tRNA synthetase